MYFKVTVQLTAVTVTVVDVTRMTAGTSRSWGAICVRFKKISAGAHD